MSHSCCLSGFEWNGTPVGKEGTLNDNKAYITGSNKDVAILLIHDIFGWTLANARLIADHYAKEVGATVYLPDLYAIYPPIPRFDMFTYLFIALAARSCLPKPWTIRKSARPFP